jgi:ABC-2 type transport system ATP-binding protein
MGEWAIECEGLRKEFGAKVAVESLSLCVPRGEIFGFLGPNGAGKSTSLKMLLGLVRPTAGTGRMLGAPLGDRDTRAAVGFLPEHFRFHDWLTGRELLRFHGHLVGLRGARLEARADALLDRVDLLDAADRPVRGYSKGMLQRVGLAQALLAEPALVLLDEPTSGLDPLGRRLVREVLLDLKRAGTTVFLNSHLLGEVEVTCERVAFVKAGRVVRELQLSDLAPGLEVELRVGGLDTAACAGLARLGTGLARDGDRVRLRVDGEERLPELARYLAGTPARLYEMRPIVRSLEAIFLETMGDDQRPG